MEKFPENKIEKIPTPEELESIFEQLVEGRDYETRPPKEDEKGICAWEIVIQKSDGGTIEYSYSRKMRHKDQKITMAIERTLFDETGFPEGGEIAAKYKDGKWVEFDSDIPVISEEDAEVLKASKAEKKKNEETRKPPEDCMPRLTEIKGLLTNFENIHDLEALHAINHLTMKTALDYPEREAAKADLIPIFSLINYLEEKTDITKEKLKELKLQFRKISQAVGIITEKEGILDHTRVAFKES